MKLSDYMVYPLTVETDGTAWTIQIDGIEGAVTETENEEEIEAQALSVFVDFGESLLRSGSVIPAAPRHDSKYVVHIPMVLALKVVLRDEMIRQGVSRTELARRMERSLPSVNQLLTLYRESTSLGALAEAFAALGKTLDVEVRP